AWIKPNGFNSMAGIISKYQDNAADGYMLRLSSNHPYTGLELNGVSTDGLTLVAGNWYHVAAVRDDGEWFLYVNGAAVSLTGEPGTILSNNNFLGIGVDYVVGGRYFNGVIDEVRVWNVVRTQQQIQDNMNAPFTSPQSGLVGYWQLNASTGTVAHNHGTGAANGTLTNFNFNETSGWLESLAPLPVELTSFTAQSVRLNAELKWSTATELNNYGFEVERAPFISAPADGKSEGPAPVRTWSKVAMVEGNGTTNAPTSYTYTDRIGKVGKYSYRLKVIDRDGSFSYSPEVEVQVGAVPKVFALEQNYPNPFNPATTVGFTLENTGLTTLKIYDVVGREVATLVNEVLEAGVYHQKQFNAAGFSSGVYFARLQSGGKTLLKKMMLVK
ncbi:MAG: T9SS type A sorting domain-containing protein, partial [Bacteroidetes bacterium]|nr:T9SS type A sorting domain-containing protein [Bacteroidota bacterium]